MRSKKAVFGILFFIMTFLFAQSAGFAESYLDSLSLGLEKDIGLSNYQSITSEKRVVQLPKVEADHLNNLFNRLISNCGRRKELNFTLTVIQDDSVNAFALPGGYVFVNTGLLDYVKNDSELAGILGHEIAHVDRRHSMKAIYRAVGFSALVGLLLNNGDDIRRKEIMGQIAGISISLAQLGYSRGAELEADRYGVEIMQRAGYNKQKLLNFWHRFQIQNGDTSKTLTIFGDHPPTSERIKRIEGFH
jgi:beta-barrel assembly-enhancing protease